MATYSHLSQFISGTNTVIEACLMNDVPRLVYTSSVDSVSPLKDCFNLEEVKWYYPKASELAMPEYAITKQKAERLVIGSHGRSLAKALHSELTYPNDTLQIILPCINVCTELPAENRFRLD